MISIKAFSIHIPNFRTFQFFEILYYPKYAMCALDLILIGQHRVYTQCMTLAIMAVATIYLTVNDDLTKKQSKIIQLTYLAV